MKKLLLIAAFILSVSCIYGQALPAANLLNALTLKATKFDDWLAKKKFFFTNTTKHGDTLVKLYDYKAEIKKKKPLDSVKRSVTRRDNKDEFILTYQTASIDEFADLITQLKQAGFYCSQDEETGDTKPLLFQYRDVTVTTFTETKDSISNCFLLFYKKTFPDPQDINYADDLLCFTSHEYLVHYFGEENVKKDIYYFSGNELAKCSVLFLNTGRQVVYIWNDEVNKRDIANLLFGGQQRLKSLMGSDKFIAESNWIFKSGIHAGMPLYELRMLNGGDIKFYGSSSVNAGIVVPDNAGKINFKKEEIILGCMNCSDGKFASSAILNADDALTEGKILFILSVILKPDPDNKRSVQSTSPAMVTK